MTHAFSCVHCVLKTSHAVSCTHCVQDESRVQLHTLCSRRVALSVALHSRRVVLLCPGGWLKCCFTSTETVGLLGMGAQDSHLDFHTTPVLCVQDESRCQLHTLRSRRVGLLVSCAAFKTSRVVSQLRCVQDESRC